MSSQKHAKPFKIALIHALSTYIIVSLIFLMTGIIFYLIKLNKLEIENILISFLGGLLNIVFIWFIGRSSARWLNRKYVITDRKNVLFTATFIFVILEASLRFSALGSDIINDNQGQMMVLASSIISVLTFFLVTRKYINPLS